MASPTAILVVEPDTDIRELLIEILTGEGYRTASASTGLAALAFDQPAITLFDTALPDLGPSELIGQLQKNGLLGVRLALMGTIRRGKLPVRMPETIAYLEKPFDLDVPLSLVAQYVEPQMRLNRRASETDRT